jgi:hypothetical protein
MQGCCVTNLHVLITVEVTVLHCSARGFQRAAKTEAQSRSPNGHKFVFEYLTEASQIHNSEHYSTSTSYHRILYFTIAMLFTKYFSIFFALMVGSAIAAAVPEPAAQPGYVFRAQVGMKVLIDVDSDDSVDLDPFGYEEA